MRGSRTPLDDLRAAVMRAAAELTADPARGAPTPGRSAITLERPPRPDLGDYSTNAALLLAAGLGSSPREVAERLGGALQSSLGPSLERFEVAGPGFLNLFLSDSWLTGALAEVLAAG